MNRFAFNMLIARRNKKQTTLPFSTYTNNVFHRHEFEAFALIT